MHERGAWQLGDQEFETEILPRPRPACPALATRVAGTVVPARTCSGTVSGEHSTHRSLNDHHNNNMTNVYPGESLCPGVHVLHDQEVVSLLLAASSVMDSAATDTESG